MSVTQPIIHDEPEWGSVEGYLETLREKAAQGWDLYPYAYGLATSTASSPTHPVEERIRRIANLDAAMQAINEERRARYEAAAGPVHFLEADSDGDDDDRMACGQRFGDAVKTGFYTGVAAKVTCPECRPVADVWSD